jgi:hypothetical protein
VFQKQTFSGEVLSAPLCIVGKDEIWARREGHSLDVVVERQRGEQVGMKEIVPPSDVYCGLVRRDENVSKSTLETEPHLRFRLEVLTDEFFDSVQVPQVLKIVESEVVGLSRDEIGEQRARYGEVRLIAPEREPDRLASSMCNPNRAGDLPELVSQTAVPSQLAICNHVRSTLLFDRVARTATAVVNRSHVDDLDLTTETT